MDYRDFGLAEQIVGLMKGLPAERQIDTLNWIRRMLHLEPVRNAVAPGGTPVLRVVASSRRDPAQRVEAEAKA